MFARLVLLWAVAVAVYAQKPAPVPGKRLALVIGNRDYSPLPPIASAVDEANVIADALRKAGFDVQVVSNMTPQFITKDETAFVDRVNKGDICVIYYSGYAVQGEDDNYLLPVNFLPNSNKELQDRAYHLSRMQQKLEQRGAALKIFIIEGARPMEAFISGAAGPGLKEPDLTNSRQTLFSFDAPPGQTLPQDAVPIARFTKAAAKYIGESGLSLSQIFASVKGQVSRENPQAPIPYEVDNVTIQDFYFHAPVKRVEPVEITRKKDELSPGLPVQNKRDRLEYVWIPKGTFKMGCVPGSKCEQNEMPQHAVTVSKGFFMGRTEVEVEAYQRYSSSQGLKMPRGNLDDSRWKTTNNPMSNVSWEEAASYCVWAGGRLPSEAEWEYGARGGLEDQTFPLNDENSRDKANFFGKKGNDIYDGVAPVKKFDPNPFGLFDMAGNVWEWVNDLYSPSYYQQSPGVDPAGPSDGKEHVARGGSFDSNPKLHLRISFRRSFAKPGNLVGFRCVLEDSNDTRKALNLPLKSN